MTKIVALYDANVLYPAPLRDLLMQLAFDELIQARLTNTIHDEWIRNVIKNRPDLSLTRLQNVAKLMNDSIEGILIQGFEHLIEGLTLPDPDDRHVLAAAIHGQVDVIVTNNQKDFPIKTLEPYGLSVQSADDFVTGLLEVNDKAVREVIATIQRRLRKPSLTMLEYFTTLEMVGLHKTVKALRN